MSNFLPLSERNLILTGDTGASLAAIGQQIASSLRKPFVSVDALIAERMDLTIDELRTYFGERRLKAIEAEIIQETALRRDSVIYVSGRILAQAEHRERLADTGPIICLVVTLDIILQRLHVSMGARYHNPSDRALALGELRREWGVRGQDNITEIDVSYVDHEMIMQIVIDTWQAQAIERL